MSFTEFLDKAIEDKIKDIQTGMVAEIVSFDGQTLRADVQPLLKIENESGESLDLPVLADLPVLFLYSSGFYVRPFYEEGDFVWIGFSTYDFENALRGYSRAASKKKFEIHNAVVVAGLAKENYSPPTTFAANDGLLIGDNNFIINFDGNALILGDPLGIHIKFDGAGIQVCSAPGVCFNLITHQHTTGVGPSGPPTPGT